MISSSKMLKRSTTAFRSIHLLRLNCYLVRNRGITCSDQGLYCYSTTSPCVNYGRDDANNRLLLLPILKAHSHQHLCTGTTTSNVQSSDQSISSSKLPDSIDQQCVEWAQIVRAEWEVKIAKHTWYGVKMRCTSVLRDLNTSKLFLSNEGLSPEQWRTLRQVHRVGKNVELKNIMSQQQQQQPNSSTCSLEDNLSGTVAKQFPDGILIRIHRRLNIQETQLIQQCSFDIREAENPIFLESRLNFLAKRNSDWCEWPGYGAMLQAFKCQPLEEDTGLDPVDWVGSHGKDLDPSQCAALSAALNLKRPIVAVHGPPGSGKTHILAEYLHAISQQGKKVLVVSSTNAGVYHLMGTFCKKFPSDALNKGTFLSLKHFDTQMASKVIANETIEKLIEKNSIAEIAKNIDEETKEFYDQTKALKSAMEKRPDLREDDLLREAEEVFEQTRGIGHQRSDEMRKNLLQSTSIVFTNKSSSMLNMFIRLGLTFDVVIIDDAANLSEFDSWMMALPTAPVLRLIGDYSQSGIPVYSQSGIPVNSSLGRELNFRRSLLQRLDEQFVRRQYRSNAAIQAWPNRAFYGQRAAEPDESVRGIRLDDLLEEGKSPPQGLITDPLVLVDLGQLEGEWREWMFKTEKGGRSWFNWGEAFLAASHLYNLFEHIPQLHPSKIGYLTRYDAQRIRIELIFSTLFGRNLQKLGQIRLEHNKYFHGQQFDVLLKDSVTVPLPKLFTDPFHLKLLSNMMCRARRQFIWFANSKWLEQGSEQSRQLLRTFREYGRIVGPNELLPFGPGQFSEMTKKVEDNFWRMRDRGMQTNKYGKY